MYIIMCIIMFKFNGIECIISNLRIPENKLLSLVLSPKIKNNFSSLLLAASYPTLSPNFRTMQVPPSVEV